MPRAGQRNEDLCEAEVHVRVEDQRHYVNPGEDQRQPSEEPVQIEDPVRARLAVENLGRQRESPQHARSEQCPGDDAAAAGDVPPQLLVHLDPSMIRFRSSAFGNGLLPAKS